MSELARVAGPLGCAGLVLLLLATRRDARLAGLAAWVLGAAGLAAYLAPSGRIDLLTAAAVGGAVASAGGAYVLLRWPWALAFATLACVPIRIPLSIGDEEANLLLPLYFVVSSLALALGWQLLRGDPRTRELGPLALPLAALVGWTGLSLLWTDDLRRGAIFLLAFVLPFGLLSLGFARLPWERRPLVWLYGALLATAVAFAGIGLYQWVTRDVFWNPRVIVGNAYAPFYRVNSVFWDPSIYGRYLVVAILATLALVLLGLRTRPLARRRSCSWGSSGPGCSSRSRSRASPRSPRECSWRPPSSGAGVRPPRSARSPWSCSRSASRRRRCGRRSSTSPGPVSTRRRAAAPVSSRTGSGSRATTRSGAWGSAASSVRTPTEPASRAATRRRRRPTRHPSPSLRRPALPGLLLFLWLGLAALGATLLGAHRTDAGRAALVVGLTLGAIAVHSVFYNALFEDPTSGRSSGSPR